MKRKDIVSQMLDIVCFGQNRQLSSFEIAEEIADSVIHLMNVEFNINSNSQE